MAQTTNGDGHQTPTPPAVPPIGQQLVVNAQYIKDLSFENPRAPQSLTQPNSPPAVEINVDVTEQYRSVAHIGVHGFSLWFSAMCVDSLGSLVSGIFQVVALEAWPSAGRHLHDGVLVPRGGQ